MDGKQAIKVLQKQYRRQNEYIKQNYDRVSITLPKGTKDRIQAAGETANGLIKRLVLNWLDTHQERTQAPEDAPPITEDPEMLPFM